MGAEAVAALGVWGTWEELILGGAVLRHGADDWNVVASELHARTRYPCAFTPQACKEKYEDLKRRYSGSSTAWFDELRKQRVAELKRELAKSDDSIGSLESKIKSLEGERKNYGRNEPQSPSLALVSNLTEPLSVETSNNENSAGSFIKDTIARANWSFENQDNNNNNRDVCSHKLVESNSGNGGVVTRKRRGQRIRKDHSNRAKETSVSGSDNLKEPSSNDCGPLVRKDSLLGIFECVAESEPAAVFRHRMDSQKRARYRRVIRQHVDIGTIRSRIIGRSIRSAKELFRDLLLVANNALVFYSRRTREYKSAASLRHLVMKEYKKHCMGSSHESTSAFVPCNPPVKPRTARPRPYPRPPPPRKEKVSEQALPVDQEGLDKQSGFDDNVSRNSCLLNDRRGLKHPGKLKRRLVDTRDKSCVKQTKRVRM